MVDGTFHATANSFYNMKEFKDLVGNFDSRLDYVSFSVAKEFGLENGAEQLSKHFDSVKKLITFTFHFFKEILLNLLIS